MCSSPKTLSALQILGNNHFEDASSLLRLFLLPVVVFLPTHVYLGRFINEWQPFIFIETVKNYPNN